jgi:hypothetical protein
LTFFRDSDILWIYGTATNNREANKMHKITKADRGVDYEFNSYPERPDSDITGECWVYVDELDENGEVVGSYGYCNEIDCNCQGSQSYS